jgi:hypothetical protein
MEKRAAIYVRVSTNKQTNQNQVSELRRIAERRGWEVVHEYHDAGISGAKSREGRPGLDQTLKDAQRRRFDVVMAWAIDRLGRSPLWVKIAFVSALLVPSLAGRPCRGRRRACCPGIVYCDQKEASPRPLDVPASTSGRQFCLTGVEAAHANVGPYPPLIQLRSTYRLRNEAIGG